MTEEIKIVVRKNYDRFFILTNAQGFIFSEGQDYWDQTG